MLKNQQLKILILLISIIIISGYFFINSLIGNQKFSNLKSFLSVEQKELIKKYIFPYKIISQHEQTISQHEQTISQHEQTISQQQQSNKVISQQQRQISRQQQTISHQQQSKNLIFTNLELANKENSIQIETYKKSIKLFDNKTLDKYKLVNGFYAGIHNQFPGSGYIDFYKGNIIVLSSRGVLAFKKNIEDTEENFQQIKNNINEFIGINQFKKKYGFH